MDLTFIFNHLPVLRAIQLSQGAQVRVSSSYQSGHSLTFGNKIIGKLQRNIIIANHFQTDLQHQDPPIQHKKTSIFSFSSRNQSRGLQLGFLLFVILRYMFGLRMKDQLSLDNASSFFEDQGSLENLLFFVNEVPLKAGYREYDEFAFKRVAEAFKKAASLHNAKIIRPMRILLLRILKENLGFVAIHVNFLQFCKKYSVPHEALPIIQYPGMFKHASRNTIAQFLIHSCDIYISLQKYRQAFDLLSRAAQLQFIDSDLELKLVMRRVVLCITLGQPVMYEIKERLKAAGNKEVQLKALMSEAKKVLEELKENEKICEFLLTLDEYRTLTPEEEAILKSQGLFDAFEASKGANLGSYIKDTIKKNNWRVKATDVKGCQLHNLEIIKGINLSEQIYRYDYKNSIMYFNHKESDQEKLNSLISKAFNMSQQVVSCKIERKQERMGGMRGMGGMGGGMGMDFMRMMGGMRGSPF